MSNVILIVLRRLRTPLIILVIVYAIAAVGMTLIPGIDDQGNPWKMSLFHAFYFVSFMGTTIGFGEIPYEFTDAQRFWVLLCIYTSVIAWLYGIGTMLGLIQDPAFQQAVTHQTFQRSIKRIKAYLNWAYKPSSSTITKNALAALNWKTSLSLPLHLMQTLPNQTT